MTEQVTNKSNGESARDESAERPAPTSAAGKIQRSGSRPAGRKLAEWVTLGLCAAIVAGVTGFLVYAALHEDAILVPARVEARLDQTTMREGLYIVPIRVENLGRRTLKDLKVRVTFREDSAAGGMDSEDMSIEYLGERAATTLYIYFDHDPAALNVRARALGYSLE